MKSFGAWHDEQFDDCGFFSTPTAHRHDVAKLTLLRVEFESVDPDFDAAFTRFVQALARKSRKRVTVLFDGDGDFDSAELEALLQRVGDDTLFGDRLRARSHRRVERRRQRRPGRARPLTSPRTSTAAAPRTSCCGRGYQRAGR